MSTEEEASFSLTDGRTIAEGVSDVVSGWLAYLHAYEGAKAYVRTHPTLSAAQRSRLFHYDALIASVESYG